MKERALQTQFANRYEQELIKIQQATLRKVVTKQTSKVYGRIGRAKQKYASIHHLFTIEIEIDDTINMVKRVT